MIQTEQTVLAAVGDRACLTCQLTEYKEVVQFTWQKILPDGEKNLATHAKAFGQRVSPDLKRKMDFHCTALQSCSVVIRKVTEQDEGCYRCLFNTYPQGAVIGTTCLRLCGKTTCRASTTSAALYILVNMMFLYICETIQLITEPQ